jgi:hypothetical protein
MMDIKQLLQTLVETDDKESRLLLVEENAALLEPGETEPGVDWEAKYNALLDRYTKAFINGPEATDEPETEPETEPDEPTPTLDELFPQ